MEDGCENCPIDEAEEPLPLPLPAAEAQAILYGEYPIEEVFSDLCNEPLSEDFINDLAEKKIFAMNMSIIVAEAVATNLTIILMHANTLTSSSKNFYAHFPLGFLWKKLYEFHKLFTI